MVEKPCLMEYDLTVDNEEKEMDECFSNLLSGRDTALMASTSHQNLPMHGAAVDIAVKTDLQSTL